MTVSFWTYVLGTQLSSSVKATSPHNHLTVSPTQLPLILKIEIEAEDKAFTS